MLTVNLASASLIETVLQKMIAADPNIKEVLLPLNGKRASVQLTDFHLTYVFCFSDTSVTVESSTDEPSNVQLKGTSFAFFNMALTEKGSDALFNGEVHFEGEVTTAQKFQTFWTAINIDWEDELSKVTGDVMAHHIGTFARNSAQHLQSVFKTVTSNFTEYVQEESRVTPTQYEVDDFFDDIADLKSDVDRFSSRVQRLENTLKSRHSNE